MDMARALKMESILKFVDSFKRKNEMVGWFTQYCVSDLLVKVGDDTLTLDTFRDSLIAITESSPKLTVEVLDIHRDASGSVLLYVQLTGQHTGQPYRYLDYAPIEAAGCVWKNDPEILVFTPDKRADCVGKVGEIGVFPDEKSALHQNGFVGPKGIYQQLSLHAPSA